MNRIHTTITDTRRWFEITAVFSTGLGKFLFMDYLNYRFLFISISITLWIIYIIVRTKSSKTILKYWGFRKDNFISGLKIVLPFGMLSILAFGLIGYYQNTINLNWHILPILVIYPIWGVIQQFLVISLVAGNLSDLENTSLKRWIVVFLTAVLFSLIHYPFNWLIVGTFLLALFYCYVFLKVRNIWVLGLFHGWLGGLFFYTVVNRDPFVEVFGKYLE